MALLMMSMFSCLSGCGSFPRHGQLARARAAVFDDLHQVRLHHHAVVGQVGHGVGDLQRRVGVVAGAVGHRDGVAADPLAGIALEALALPFLDGSTPVFSLSRSMPVFWPKPNGFMKS
jgi:hypothetical protein